jgi:protocatechuate 3,4-dioxygenase beta subunit
MRWPLVIALFVSLPALAADVVGFVYTQDGTPVSGATISATMVGSDDVLAKAKSDDGEFTLANVPEAILELEVRADGFPPRSVLSIPGPVPVSVVLGMEPENVSTATNPKSGDRSVSGVVRVGGKPLVGAPVMIQAIGEGAIPPLQVISDAKGRYAANALAPGRYMVVLRPELQPRLRSPHDVEMTPDGVPSTYAADLQNERSATIDFELTAAPIVYGRVTDADGKPVSRAQVQVVLAGRSTLDFAYEPSVRTMKDGRYATTAPPFDPAETAAVAVSLRGHATVQSKPFKLGASDRQLDIALPRFQSVTVHVATRDNKPIPKARVGFASSEETLSMRGVASLLLPQFAPRTVRTDDAGEVVLQLVPGSWDFAVAAENFLKATIEERSIVRPASVAFTLDPAFTIHGRLHRDGIGVADARVFILSGERARDESSQIVTDAKGAFEIAGLPPGKHRLNIVKPQELVQRIVTAEAPSTIDVALPAAAELRLRVIDAATREPVREFLYSIEPNETADEMARTGVPMLQRGESTTDGTIAMTLSRGAYRVGAAAIGYIATTPVDVRLTEREPTEVTLALERGITLRGRVTDENGTPLADAAVYVENIERSRTSRTRTGPDNARSADDGTFTITGIESRHVTVSVRKDGFVPLRKAIDVDDTASLDVQLTRGLTLEGMVRRSGKPAANIQVDAVTAALGGFQQQAMSDANGHFVLRGLVAARYTVSAYSEDQHTQIENVDPTKEQELVLSLDPQPTAILFGTVTGMPANLGGKIVRRVVFVQGNDRGAEGLVDEAGNYRIEDAPSGTVYVTAQLETPTNSRSSTRKRVELVAGQAQRVDLELVAAVTVRGRVTQDGKPMSGVRVVFATEMGIGGSASSHADGMYEVGLPAAGTYQVFAHAESLATGNVQLVRDVRGGDTVDIELREQILEGTVVDAITREPLQNISVTLMPEGAPMQSYAGETFTDGNGRFRIITASTGAYRAIAWGPGYAQRTQSLQLGSGRAPQIAFELTKTGELRVRVIDAKSGAPLAAHLVLQTPDGAFLPVRGEQNSAQGSFIYSLAEGKYWLTAVVAGYAERKVEVTAPGNVDIALE